jgi:pyruvate,water dikinase
MYLLWLGQPACNDVTLVGGKVANLSRLATDYTTRVPAGFCLTTSAFREWEPDVATLPPTIYKLLATAYDALVEQCGDPKVAVRSSAVDEDGPNLSFAGQYETYLNLSGVEAVAQAVVRCWASAHSARVEAYRRQRVEPNRDIRQAGRDIRLAVLVQQLVVADMSAVVFSANPVSGKRDEIVINATWGLGESLVGGTVTPDTYVVRQSDLTLIKRQIATKQRMTVLLPNGTREVCVPRLMSKQPAISDAQAVDMAQLALTLETRMGWPVDLECAYRAQKLYLLQCRPITTLGQSRE